MLVGTAQCVVFYVHVEYNRVVIDDLYRIVLGVMRGIEEKWRWSLGVLANERAATPNVERGGNILILWSYCL